MQQGGLVLVAGGSGFIGSAVTRELVRRGRPVAVLSRDPRRVGAALRDVAVEGRQGDVRDPSTLDSALAGVETVINAVQFPGSPIEQPRKGYTFDEVDYKGTLNLVAAAKRCGARRFVYLSGAGASPKADKHWFRLKWQAEEAIRGSGLTYTIFRPSWVYGPRDVSLNRFLNLSRFLPFVPIFGTGKQRMQPVYVEDVARAVADSLESAAAENATFEIGGPDVMTMDDVVRTALRVLGRRRLLLHPSARVAKLAAAPLRLLPSPPLTPDAIDFITHDAVADNTALIEALHPRLTPLREGLETYLTAAGSMEERR